MQSTIWPETLFPIGNSRKLGPRTQSGPRRKSDVYEGGAREDSLGVPQGRSVRPCRLQEPPCRRTSQRCSGSRGALGQFSDLERPAASIDRISFTVSRGTVISSILPGRARQSNRPGETYGEGRAPGPRGAALLLKLLNFSCSRCSFPSDHSDHFLVNINNQRYRN